LLQGKENTAPVPPLFGHHKESDINIFKPCAFNPEFYMSLFWE
jgi:hypothetical protein